MGNEGTRPLRALVLGGARSGKSAFAERLAARLGEPVVYVATAQVGDDEMRNRVRKHRERRPERWRTVEASRDVAGALHREGCIGGSWLIDSVTQLVAVSMTGDLDVAKLDPPSGERVTTSAATFEPRPAVSSSPSSEPNLRSEKPSDQSRLDSRVLAHPANVERTIEEELDSLFELAGASGANILFVSDEVGLGIVPDYPSGRLFRDLLGAANQRLARECNEVYWMVAGLALECKGLAVPWPPTVR